MEYKRLFDKDTTWKHGKYLPDELAHLMQYEKNSGYGESPRNGIEDRIDRIAKTLGKLMAALNAKNILSNNEVFEIVGLQEYEVKNQKLILKHEVEIDS